VTCTNRIANFERRIAKTEQLRSEGPETGDGYTWFDNVGIIEWEDWQSLTAFDNIVTPNDYYWIQIRTDVATDSATVTYEETMYNTQPGINILDQKQAVGVTFLSFPNPTTSEIMFQYYLSEPVECR